MIVADDDEESCWVTAGGVSSVVDGVDGECSLGFSDEVTVAAGMETEVDVEAMDAAETDVLLVVDEDADGEDGRCAVA